MPAVLVIIAVMSYPFVYCIYLSFRATPSYTTETHFTGLANYAAVVHDSVFLNSLLITVIWTIGSTVSDILLGMVAAVLVNQLTWFRGPIRAALMMPYIVGYVIASYAWLWLYQGEYGLINQLLTVLACVVAAGLVAEFTDLGAAGGDSGQHLEDGAVRHDHVPGGAAGRAGAHGDGGASWTAPRRRARFSRSSCPICAAC